MIREYLPDDMSDLIRIWNEAVSADVRGKHIGGQLVMDCLKQGKELGFRVLQFNAVVESNVHARHLYERLGFIQLKEILI